MTTTDLLLSVLAVLTYFAGVQRGKRYRAEDRARHEAERKEALRRDKQAEETVRIRGVVDRYRQLVVSYDSDGLTSMLKAGVLSLQSGDEVQEACRLIKTERLPPAIPEVYMAQLDGVDLLAFFNLVSARRAEHAHDDAVTRIIKELKGGELT
jgi:hypothetical protein